MRSQATRYARRVRCAFLAQLVLVLVLGVGTAAASASPAETRATYILVGDLPAVPAYAGGIRGLAATSPRVLGQPRLAVRSSAVRAYRAFLAVRRNALLERVQNRIGHAPEVLFRYDMALDGMALRLTADEATRVAALPGVSRVLADEMRYLQTDNGPAWIGATGAWDGSGTTGGSGTKGEGVVVGVIDTGINTNHPSFADIGPVDGYNHINPRPRFFGLCAPVTGAPFCNDKLIGVYDFTGTGTGEDANGHGSHTASTVGGNVLNARLVTPTTAIDRRISGVAPHANLIAYRACQEVTEAAGLGGCTLNALLAAINQAVADDVDVINYSIGGGSADPWSDADALAFLNARRAGIFVSASAGNEGPGASSVGSPADAPWLLTVAASTHDRKFVNALVGMTGGGSTPPGDIQGAGVTSAYGPKPIVYAGTLGFPLCGDGAAAADGSAATNPFTPGTFHGEIVVCDRGTYGRVEKAQNVMEGGAGGFVLANDEASGDSLVGDPYPIPGVHISYANGLALKAWLASGTGHTGRVAGTSLDIAKANGDVMASFSSRGPNPATGDLLKPDVTAPGVDILAAFHDGAGAAPQFGVISGTSMSSPHSAGAAALVIAQHPSWTPDEVRSAIMTTAFTKPPGTNSEVHAVLKENGVTPADPFDMGAGRIDLRLAGKAGLVLDETASNYVAANPAAGGDPKKLNLPSMADDECDGFCTWTRVLENARSSSVTWTASATASSGVTISVAPKTFTIAPGGTRTISVTADVSDAAPARWQFGQVVLTPSVSSIPQAHLPVALFVKGDAPDARTVLHFHGNSGAHDSGDPGEAACTGDGKADLIACNGPMLLSSDKLSAETAASWKGGAPEWTFTGAGDRTIHDPNWVWCLSVHPACPTTQTPAPGTTTMEGPMTVEWWTECLALCAVSTAEWHVRLWADGVQVVDARVPTVKIGTAGAVHRLRATATIPRITATQRFTLQLEPVFLVDQAVQFGIYYDSSGACPTASAGPCDSVVKMPVAGSGGGNGAPDAVDDTTAVAKGGSATVAVLGNDTDPDGDTLSVSSATSPTHGTATVNENGTITYTHANDAAASDSFTYTISDGRGGSDTASVSVTITQDQPPAGDGSKTTGGGWLAGDDGGKINFGFKVTEKASGLDGDLDLNDKGSNVKIHLATVTRLGAVESACGSVPAAPSSIELRGTGTYNGTAEATFRVCVEDAGQGAGTATGDRFYLACTSGCSYDTGGPAVDDAIDGGNIQVRRATQTAADTRATTAEQTPATMILDPLLMTAGVVGQAQLFMVCVFDGNQELLPNASVTLTRVAGGGVIQTLTSLTGAEGTATFTLANLASSAEYVATAGGAQSNAIALTPLTG